MAEKIQKRGGDELKRQQATKNYTAFSALKTNYHICKNRVTKEEEKYDNELVRKERAQELLNNMIEKLMIAQEEVDADYLPEAAQPRERIQKRDRLKLQVAQLEVALDAQLAVVEKVKDSVRLLEKDLFVADKDMNSYITKIEDAESIFAIQKELDEQRALKLGELEKKKVKRWEEEQKSNLIIRSDQVKEVHDLASKKLASTKTQHSKAVNRLSAANAKTSKMANRILEAKTARLEERADQVLELKTNINHVQSELATISDKHNKKLEAARRELESEKESMLSKGLNPYVEFRKRDFNAEAERREKRLHEAVELNKLRLSERLLKEEDVYRKEEAIDRKNRAYEKKHRDEQGREVVEGRNERYITEVTTDHVQVLDPAGRASRVDPSQITDIADWSIGIGKTARIPSDNMKRIIDGIRENLKMEETDFGEYKRLVTGLLPKGPDGEPLPASAILSSSKRVSFGETGEGMGNTNTVSQSATKVVSDFEKQSKLQELQRLANESGSIPGATGAAVTLNLEGNEGEKLIELVKEAVGDDVQNQSSLKEDNPPKYVIPEPSKFEKDSFSRAKIRQKDRLELGTTQVAAGKTFRGQSFVPKPAEIEFKDFEVGKVYKKRFTLTNASLTFNSFKILSLPDEVIDFFVITFEKPGRMSAGVSCPIEVCFSPQVNQDIFTDIKFLTETGPVAVPVRCLIRRCAPKVQVTEINFDGVIIGEKKIQSFKIVNSQIIPTSFKIKLVESKKTAKLSSTAQSSRVVEGVNNDGDPETAIESVGGELFDAKETGSYGNGNFESENQLISSADSVAGEQVEEVSISAESSSSSWENEEEIEIGSTPAFNQGELMARVRNVLTSVLRQKKKETPFPLSIHIPHSAANDGAANGDGKPQASGTRKGGGPPDPSSKHEFYVGGYNQTSVDILCAPLMTGSTAASFVITFDAVPRLSDGSVDEQGQLITRNQSIEVKAVGGELPIYIPEDTMDLRCTLHGRLYRKRVTVYNRAKTAYRVNVVIPRNINKFVDVSPDMFFVQGGGSQDINLKFTPSEDILRKLSHFSIVYEDFLDAAALAFPIQLQVVGQELPVFFVIKTDVTTSTLVLSQKVIDFGKIYVSQQATLKLGVRNTSMLPQKIAFVRLKKELTISPNEGFAVLLPNEEMFFDIAFSPLSAIEYNIDLTLVTSLNDTYIVKVHGLAVEPPVVFSSAVVKLQGTGPGGRVVENVLVTNNTKKRQIVEIMLPERKFSWLKISPTVLELEPGRSTRVEVEYFPPKDVLSLEPKKWHADLVNASPESKSPYELWEDDGRWVTASGIFGSIQWAKPLNVFAPAEDPSPVAGASQASATSGTSEAGIIPADARDTNENNQQFDGYDDGSAELADAPLAEADWGILGSWRLPLFVQPRNATIVVATESDDASSTTADSAAKQMPLFFSVQTLVTQPELEIDCTELDFGQMAVGLRRLKTVKIKNNTDHDITLRRDGLNAVGPFTVLNAAASSATNKNSMFFNVGARMTKRITIECLPVQPGLVIEVVEYSPLDGCGHHVRLTLKTQGVNPTVEIQGLLPAPNNWGGPLGGILDFGSAVAMDVITKKITVVNKSLFNVHVSITRILGEGLSPFDQSKVIERTITGLPIFSYRPENATIEQGKSLDVEVVFRADRARVDPFREDLKIDVGQSDGDIKVCVCGRTFSRQLFLVPANPLDEPFAKLMLQTLAQKPLDEKPFEINPVNGKKIPLSQDSDFLPNPNNIVEDILGTNRIAEVRSNIQQARANFGLDLQLRKPLKIKLEYPDPFSDAADASSYVTIDPGASSVGAKAGAKGAQSAQSSISGRQQSRKLVISSAKVMDGRPNSLAAGTFEVALSPEAVRTGMFRVSLEKGPVNVGSDVTVEIFCTLPTPKGVGGLQVGSWQTFPGIVSLKGGWKADGEPEEVKVEFLLSAFVRL